MTGTHGQGSLSAMSVGQWRGVKGDTSPTSQRVPVPPHITMANPDCPRGRWDSRNVVRHEPTQEPVTCDR